MGAGHPNYLPAYNAREIREMMVHRGLYPWGLGRVTMGEAQIWAAFCNANRRQGSRPFTPLDLMPQLKKKPDPEFKEARAAFWAIGTVVNGAVDCKDQH